MCSSFQYDSPISILPQEGKISPIIILPQIKKRKDLHCDRKSIRNGGKTKIFLASLAHRLVLPPKWHPSVLLSLLSLEGGGGGGGGGEGMGEGRSLAETPTWSVATVTTAMIAVCFLVERCIYRFAKWLKKTKRKAMLAALEKIREELMLLGLISLMLSQTARWISEICVPSSLFNSRFYTCTESDFQEMDEGSDSVPSNRTKVARRLLEASPHNCAEDHEPFVSFEGLEQLHRFVFILGITHVLYSFVTVVLSMIKIYSWRKWENQAHPPPTEDLQG
ncbi:MLO-like protein 4 [Phoenix dactylifera]|uniref:MLO-like protein 4 n=1 Tax=Phoenix dactylifera TaxID=42345 RepID=A0A8B8ZYI6_PHODC|nr:MLO-like protein 4 [Phoenix dactylifera]XP_038981282.1 MLO-like protein 4 [Phoenix dactylifera]